MVLEAASLRTCCWLPVRALLLYCSRVEDITWWKRVCILWGSPLLINPSTESYAFHPDANPKSPSKYYLRRTLGSKSLMHEFWGSHPNLAARDTVETEWLKTSRWQAPAGCKKTGCLTHHTVLPIFVSIWREWRESRKPWVCLTCSWFD